jgi:hypothetical protein
MRPGQCAVDVPCAHDYKRRAAAAHPSAITARLKASSTMPRRGGELVFFLLIMVQEPCGDSRGAGGCKNREKELTRARAAGGDGPVPGGRRGGGA